jgi:hypothetical protein
MPEDALHLLLSPLELELNLTTKIDVRAGSNQLSAGRLTHAGALIMRSVNDLLACVSTRSLNQSIFVPSLVLLGLISSN